MPLRVRLVAAVLLMTLAGLVVFGIVTTSVYSNSQYSRIDAQMGSATRFAADRIEADESGTVSATVPGASDATTSTTAPSSATPTTDRSSSLEPTTSSENRPPPNPNQNGTGGGSNLDNSPSFTYAELRESNGRTVVGTTRLFGSSTPKLPTTLAGTSQGTYLDVGSTSGSTEWRVFAQKLTESGRIIIVAQPLTNVDAAINRLIAIELGASLGLLIVLGVGSWLIMRRGLRPLETMAGAARSISAGNLHERVSPSENRTEIGQLGLALNTMLTEIEQAFSERDETEQRLRQFLADASHELRTPLTSIQGFAELFRMGADQDRDRLEVIFRRISEESARMRNLVEDLLLLARLDEVRPYERGSVDLAVLCADACTDAKATSPDRPIALDAPSPVVVAGVGDHLRQAIANLLTNAIRHTPDGTKIDVSAYIEGDHAVVSVRDYGPGLPPDSLAKVFDRFWQADAARVGTGSGLGLSIVHGIAVEHGGHADVRNEPDGGACFTLRLPVAMV